MNNLIDKETAFADTPTPQNAWKELHESRRIEIVKQSLSKNNNYSDFKVINALDDGQIILKIEKSIPANLRGSLLLDCEESLKKNIDRGITIWLEPVGDKSKLRNLRGVEIKMGKLI
tara:strand:+ start:108 stop:458 length:351 start_codon:yes stop_codon:yes gene_type:complete